MKSGWIFRSRIVKAMLPLREIVWQIKEQREREREEQRKKKNDTMHVGRERGTEAKER